MKLKDIIENLQKNQIQTSKSNKISATDVVKAILGSKVTDNIETLKPGMIYLTRSWTGGSLFSTMDEMPGQGGSIGLVDFGTSASAVAEAAHESFHALLQIKSKNSGNEHLVSRLTTHWLQDNFSGEFLRDTLDHTKKSKLSYQHRKYMSSNAHLKDYYQRFSHKT